MSLSVKSQVCNLALSRLGAYGSIENIDTPQKPAEVVCSKWWGHARDMALKTIQPNFALTRRYISLNDEEPVFGYSYQYRYPSDCLHFIGIGDIKDKENNYTIESGEDKRLYIRTNAYSGEPLPCRFVRKVEDVSFYTPEFIEELSWFLAYCINMEITQDVQKQQYLEQIMIRKKQEAASLNALENIPVRINTCRFKEARRVDSPELTDKR